MTITVEHNGTKITVSESDNVGDNKQVSLRWSDQNKQVQETIVVMAEQVVKLVSSAK